MSENVDGTEQPRRNVYLRSIPLDEAQGIWKRACERLGIRNVLPLEIASPQAAPGRVTAGPVFAISSSPHYHAAAMDGIAVRAADTSGASPASVMHLRVGTDAVYVNTGDPLPEDTDAVIMVEDVVEVKKGILEIIHAASPWQHTRVIGEDIVATDIVVPARQRLRPADIGALLAAGVLEVEICRAPRVTIIPTGSEIVSPGEARQPGQIPDFNSPMIATRLAEVGAVVESSPVIKDDPRALQQAIEAAAPVSDLIITLAGASAGTRDFTAEAIRSAGELLVHGVAIRPGKPVGLGIVDNTPVVAIPGYPFSAMLCCELFVVPPICWMLGVPAPQRLRVRATLSRKIASTAGSEEFVRVHMGEVNNRLVAVPMARGAGLVGTLARADGLLVIPALSEGFEKRAEVECELLRPKHEILQTVLITGSHDVALDLLASEIRSLDPDFTIASTHVGSLAGLASLRDGFCHMAGSHLLDPETGGYNWLYIRQLFGGDEVVLVTVAHRQQGFMVAPGNPKGINSWEDLTRDDVSFVNRQAGAGTRVLLDSEIASKGIEPRKINGYRRETYTHLAVASMVETGAADVGLGILAAARAREIEFIPIAMERYDLAMSPSTFESRLGEVLLRALQSERFRSELDALGGYIASETGKRQQPPNEIAT